MKICPLTLPSPQMNRGNRIGKIVSGTVSMVGLFSQLRVTWGRPPNVRFGNYHRGLETVIAVGTVIADRPPHRSVRAALPHTALTLDADMQTARWDTDEARRKRCQESIPVRREQGQGSAGGLRRGKMVPDTISSPRTRNYWMRGWIRTRRRRPMRSGMCLPRGWDTMPVPMSRCYPACANSRGTIVRFSRRIQTFPHASRRFSRSSRPTI